MSDELSEKPEPEEKPTTSAFAFMGLGNTSIAPVTRPLRATERPVSKADLERRGGHPQPRRSLIDRILHLHP